MKRLLYTLIFSLGIATASQAQLLISAGADVIKSDFQGVGAKVQMGAELNYFLIRSLSLSAGVDVWTRGGTSAVLGIRYYPINPVFIRMRGLIGTNDLAFGLGYWKGLNKRLRAEIAFDYYVVGSDAALRAGLAYRFGK